MVKLKVENGMVVVKVEIGMEVLDSRATVGLENGLCVVVVVVVVCSSNIF